MGHFYFALRGQMRKLTNDIYNILLSCGCKKHQKFLQNAFFCHGQKMDMQQDTLPKHGPFLFCFEEAKRKLTNDIYNILPSCGCEKYQKFLQNTFFCHGQKMDMQQAALPKHGPFLFFFERAKRKLTKTNLKHIYK